MKLNTNIQALITNNAIWAKNKSLEKASRNLSLGTKINRAGDDPSGLAISNKLKSQIYGLEIADRNSNDAISLIQTADSGTAEIQTMVQRLRELAVQAANGTLTDEDRNIVQIEVGQLLEEIQATSEKIQFNDRTLLNQRSSQVTFQIGNMQGNELTLFLSNMSASGLGLDDMSYSRASLCDEAINLCDIALNTISTFRAELGATQNRLEQNMTSLSAITDSTRGSLSKILDTDMALEMSDYTRNNVLVQAGLAMLAQANQKPNQLLNLLQ